MNIFGKTVEDYRWLQDLQANRATYEAFMRSKRGAQFKVLHNDKAIGYGRKNLIQDDPAQAISFLTNNLEAIQAEIEEIMYSEFRLDDYFPINRNIPEGAQTYAYRVVDKQGQGRFIENYGTNAETASVTAQIVPYVMELGGIIPHWSIEDLRSATFGGIPLDTETIRAGTEGCMQHIERVGLGTDVDQNRFEGLLNIANVPVVVAPTPWTSLDPTDIINQINEYLSLIISQTNEIFGRNISADLALYIPISILGVLERPREAFSDKTIWEFVRDQNVWTRYTGRPLQQRVVVEFDTAGGGGSQRILFGYPTESRVWEMGMSISPRVIKVIEREFSFNAPMEYKISGLNVKRPGGLLYVDGV